MGAFGVMPLFALASAGVVLYSDALVAPLVLAIMAGFVLGKPFGIVGFAWLAVCLGLAERSSELGWATLAGGSMLAGIGFTMALLIADLAFDGPLLDAAKLGILAASIVSAAVGLAVLAWLGRAGPDGAAVADRATVYERPSVVAMRKEATE